MKEKGEINMKEKEEINMKEKGEINMKEKGEINMKEKGEINMKEKGEIIEEFPKYLVSNKGRIKILSTLEDKKVFVKDDGYIATTLGNGKQSYKYVHRLVAEAFIKNKHNKPQVNNINGIKGDNRADNLEWVTPAENIRHAIDTGLLKYKKKEKEIKTSKYSKGEEVNGSKLTPEEVIEIRVLWGYREYRQTELAEMFNVDSRTINNVITKRQWKHID